MLRLLLLPLSRLVARSANDNAPSMTQRRQWSLVNLLVDWINQHNLVEIVAVDDSVGRREISRVST